jgi:hypothetical protein
MPSKNAPHLFGVAIGSLEEMQAGIQRTEEISRSFWRDVERQAPWVGACRNLTIQAVMQDKIAKKSYFRLVVDQGFQQPEFLEMLIGLAVLLSRGEKIPKADLWSGSGKTSKALAYFPTRLLALAEEIAPWPR